ncbi:hypothetical protein WL93_20495 [Burkholderia diffusa]|nr:hypothetical protein WL93_20495 [Burkholderia diffusa]
MTRDALNARLMRSTALPDDIDALKALLRERDAQVAELRQQLSSRSLEIEQLELRPQDLQAAEVTAAHETKQPRRNSARRKPLPSHLEHQERVHLPADDDCPDCGGRLKSLGEDVAEQLEYVRAHFRVIRHRHPQQHLVHFAGVLQADAFAGYAELYLDGRVQKAACMAHARRKIHDLHAVRPNAVTEEALRRICALNKIEEEIRGKPPDERRSARQERAAPLLDDMKRWFEATLALLSQNLTRPRP